MRNQATPTSDVDVLVEFDPAMKTLDTFGELALLLDVDGPSSEVGDVTEPI